MIVLTGSHSGVGSGKQVLAKFEKSPVCVGVGCGYVGGRGA